MPRIHIALLALHLLVMAVPTLALVTGAPDVTLSGFVTPIPFPPLTLAGWRDESLQTGFKAWFEAHLGLRGALVRTDNTLLYASLGETKPGADTKRCDDGVLFIGDDIWYASRRVQDRPSAEVLRALAAQLARAQRELEKRGKHMIVMLAPAKTSLYPEAIPPRWRLRHPPAESSDAFVARTLRDAFAAEGVRYGDGIRALQTFEGPREQVYPRLARHWSRFGACIALREAAKPVLDIATCDYAPRPANLEWDGEVDLYGLLNTWHATQSLPTILAPRDPPPPPPLDAPRVLFVGSSFTWMLTDAARPFVREPHVFYYNSSVYDASQLRPRLIGPVDPTSLDWPHYALDKDVYVIEILEAYAHGDMLPGFLTTLLARL